MKSQEKVPKTTENSCYWVLLMVPVTGLEPVRHRWRWILSPLRLPFHHTGNCIFKFPLQNRSSENGGQNRRAIQKTLHIHFQKVLVFQGKSHTPEDLANQILSYSSHSEPNGLNRNKTVFSVTFQNIKNPKKPYKISIFDAKHQKYKQFVPSSIIGNQIPNLRRWRDVGGM